MATRIRTLVLLILWHFGGKSDALECGYNITSSQGWIESPGYPNVYPNDIDCFYVISQPVGLRIFLNFTDFRLQGGLDCEHDYIEIRDGGSEDSPILNTQVCGSVTPSPYKTTQHIMRIRFKTDSSVNYKGFRAFYKSGAFPNEFLLVTRETDILRVDMETLSFRTIPISAQRLMAIDYDPVTDRMYWTDADSKEIRSAFLNGTNDTLVHRLDSDSRPTGLALDDISRLIFYSDAGSSFIALMTMADFKHKNLIDTNLDQPMAIVLDKVHGFLFWTDLGSQPKIERALYDGSKRKILINILLIFPTALALDTEGQRLFWMDAKMSKIESSDVNGGDRRRISQSFSPHFIGLVFYQSYLYITDRGQGHSDSGSFIHRLHVNNSTPEMLLNTDGRLMDIHIYSQNALRKGSRSCGLSNGGCSDICIPLPDNGTRCLCPDGYILDDLQKHCRQDYDACQENNGGCSHFCIQLANKRHKCWCPEGLFLSVDDKICSKDCVRNYTQLEGTLTSPGFPGNYPSDAMCIYTIEVPISYRITLIFLDFWLEEDNFCIYDKVEVHDGASLTSPLLTRLFCGNSIPDTQRSTKNVMTIVFKTDRTNSFKGFRATYTASIVPKDILLIGGSRRLTRMDIETQSYIFVPLGQTRNTFSSIEYDPQEDRLYWTSGVQLQSAFLNGTDFKVVRSFGGDVKGMALDPTARKIFYTAIYNTMIGIMSLSTLTNEVLITTNLQNPLAIALHTRKKFIFWSNVYKTANIERANYDGSNRIKIFISSSASPSALAVDYTKNRLYWVDSSTGEVQYSTLDGINRTLVYKSQHNNIHLLALCGNYIYIIGWYTANGRRSTQGELHRFNSIDNATHSFKLAFENIFSMHIYSEDICIKDHEVTLSNLNLTSVKYSTPSPFLDSSSRFTKGILPSLTHSSNMDKIAFETTTSVSATAPILTVSSAINKTTATTGHTTFDPDVSDKIILTSGHTTFDPDVSDKVILTSGHTTFDPDASNNVTLRCNSSDLKVMEGFSWTASGEGQQRRETCTAFPSPHFVGLTYISCNVSHVDRELRIHAFKLDLLQSAIASVTWIGSTSKAFHSVNTLDITCVIKAGIFADEFVAFSCLCEVLSVVTISTTSTSDNWTTCTCKSVTSTTEWYGSNTTPQRDNNQNVIELGKPVGVSISGAAVAGGAAIAVIIVIIIIAIKLIWKKRKRLTHTCVYYHKGPQLLLVQDDVTFSLLKDTFTEQEDTKDSTTGGLLLKGAFLVPVLVSFTVSFTDVSICGGNFTAAQGVIQSPNYPGNYSNNLDCAYVITQLVGYRIILTFTYFQVEAGPSCSFDFIEIRDGDSENSPLLLGRTCGWTTPYPQKSTQNNMFIRFKTDSAVTRIGFSAAFRAGVVPHEMMLVTFEESIVRMDMETLSYINIPISNLRQPAAIDYDPVGDRIYWTDLVTNGIQCAFLNGSNTTVLKNLGLVASPQGLAVDSKSRLLFYTDAGTNVIGMLTLSGLYHKYLIDTELEQPRDIVLDNRNGTLFWTDWGKTAKIERSNYDGSGRQIIVSANLTSPNGLAIDMANDRLYWTDSGTDSVESSDFNGNQRRVIFYLPGSTFLGLSLFKTELYITDWIRSSRYVSLMRRVNIDGTHPAIIFSVDARLDNVHMYSEYTDKQGLNGCGLNNGGCSHFCLPLPGNKSMCACPDRQELNATLNKCEPAHDVCSVNNGGCSHFCLALTRNTSKCSCPDGLLLNSDEKNCSLGCGGTFTNLTGVITSPKYPSNYPNRADCVYLIQQPEGLRITLTFQDFQLQDGSNCVFDYLEIRDGGLPTSPLLHLSYCGSSAPSIQRSNQNQMWLHFKSDSSQTFRGFMASYNASYIPHQFMLVTFETTILRINIETLNYIRIPASNLTQPVAVDYDPDKDRLYWTDLARQEVRSAFLNGTNTTLLRSLGSAAAPYGLAVDSKSSLLFYTDAGNDHIAMISTRGLTSNFYHKILVNSSLDSPQAIVLDVMNGFMYWTDVGKDKKIERANYDGSERITLVNTSMSYPNALALDNDKNLLYWVDSVRLEVSVLDLNSWQRKVIFQNGNRFYYGLALHKTQLYITDWDIIGTYLYQTFIIRMNTDGSNASIIISGYGQLRDIHVYSSDMENKEPNGCGVNNGGCSHMCIPRTNKSSTCLCPDGWVLAADGKTCIYNSSFPQSTTTTSATTQAATASVASVTVITSYSPLKTSISSAVSLNVSDSVATTTVFPVTTSGPTIRITSYPLSTKGTTTTTEAPSLITSELYSLTGSEKITLTCRSGGLENVINYQWNETCSGQQYQKTCTVVPKPPWDDGKAITCTAQNALGEKRVSIFILDLKYPPNAPEITVTAASGHALQIGDAASLACKIRGGKPLVSKVTFTCTGYPDNVTDVFYTTEVMSVLNIKSLRSSDNGAVCNCTAVWNKGEAYSLKATTTLNVSGSEPFNKHQVGSSVIGAAVGSIIAIIIVIAAIIVVLIILRNKGLVFWNRPERLVEDNLSYSNLESRSAAQETGYDQMKTDTSSYSQPDYFDFGFLTESTTDDTLQPGTAVRPEPAPTNPDNDHTYATVKY